MASRGLIIALVALLLLLAELRGSAELVSVVEASISASSSAPGCTPDSATNGDRFSTARGAAWQGEARQSEWWWECRFATQVEIGSILQVVGDHDFVLRNGPLTYVWQWSPDGENWSDFPSTAIQRERRTYRLHRLPRIQVARALRLRIAAVTGLAPTLREVEFYSSAQEAVTFPAWIAAVNTTHDPKLPGHGQEFIPLARSCAGWEQLQAQQVWIGDFDEEFVRTEPRPLCAFLSGNFKDWCEIAREPWRGLQAVLERRSLPIWGSCGGAQGLAILAETGVDRPWDCPHCRDARAPKTPIYTHIGHTGQRLCGDYSACIFERGPHQVQRLTNDPAFEGLPELFTVMESHCGQIEWPPAGWELIATAGPGGKTKTQCLRVRDFPIYAAQFHIEMEGTPDVSRRIMSNFLSLARGWGSAPTGRLATPAGLDSLPLGIGR